jgi:hypothetical protein
MADEDFLFNKGDIHHVCEHQKQSLREAIQKASEQELIEGDERDLINAFAKRFNLSVPQILDDQIEQSQQSVQVDVSGDHRRHFLDPSRAYYMPGTQYTIHIPFEGEGILFNVRPSSFSLNPPRGRIRDHELQLIYQTVPDTPFDIKADYARRLTEIKQHLERLRTSAQQLDQELVDIATASIRSRKAQFQAARDAMQDLGLPVRKNPPPPPMSKALPQSVSAKKRTSRNSKEWDVFVSHASEDKGTIAAPLVAALERRGLRVWYDEAVLRVGDSLRASIDNGLAKSRFGIVILSEHFFSKHWPQQELNGLASKEVNGTKVILPVWHEIDRDRIAEFSPMLADRLGTLTARGLEKVVQDLLLAIGHPPGA